MLQPPKLEGGAYSYSSTSSCDKLGSTSALAYGTFYFFSFYFIFYFNFYLLFSIHPFSFLMHFAPLPAKFLVLFKLFIFNLILGGTPPYTYSWHGQDMSLLVADPSATIFDEVLSPVSSFSNLLIINLIF